MLLYLTVFPFPCTTFAFRSLNFWPFTVNISIVATPSSGDSILSVKLPLCGLGNTVALSTSEKSGVVSIFNAGGVDVYLVVIGVTGATVRL
jgi:hypothetical protein